MKRFVSYAKIIKGFKLQPFQILDAVKRKEMKLYNLKGEEVTWEDLQYYSDMYLRDYERQINAWASNCYRIAGNIPRAMEVIEEKYNEGKDNCKNVYAVNIALIRDCCLFDYEEVSEICGNKYLTEDNFLNKKLSSDSQQIDFINCMKNIFTEFLSITQNRIDSDKKSPGRPKNEKLISDTQWACRLVEHIHKKELPLPGSTHDKVFEWVTREMNGKKPHGETFADWFTKCPLTRGKGRPSKNHEQ